MRVFLLCAFICVCACNSSFAYLTQGHFRWRNNDGDEKTATWKAAMDSSIKIADFKAIRLRAEIYNAQTSTKSLDRTLTYATSVNGPWYGIDDSSPFAAFVFEGNTGYLTNNDSTTQQLVDPTYTFWPGNIVATGDSYTDSIPVGDRREYEWYIKPTSYIQANTTYYFKSSVGSDQSILPSLTTSGTAFAAAPQPLLPNGGFESSLTGWTSTLTNGSAATFSLTTAALQVHTGSNALLVNVTNAANNSVSLTHSPITLADTGAYMIRFWALAKQRNAILNVKLNGLAVNNTCLYQIYNRFDTTKNGWQMYQFAFRSTAANTPVTVQLNFNTNTTYNLDDIEIINSKTNTNIDVQDQYDWQSNFTSNYGWLSGDNGNPVLLPDNRRAYVYNDSFMGTRNPASNVLGSTYIVNNLLVVQNGDQLSSIYGGSSGNAQNLFSPGNGNVFWNAGGIVENNLLKVVLIEISNSNYTGNTWVGTLNLPSLTVNSLVKLPATITTNPNCVFQDGAYDYLYFGASSSANETHTAIGRVPAGQLDSQTAWQFYAGNNVWTTDFTKAANILEGVAAGNVVKLGPNNYVMSGVPNLLSEIDVWFAQSPTGPWVNKSVVYNIPQEEGILAYEGHIDPLGKNGVYSLSYSVYPFVNEPDGSSGSYAMQLADKTTYVPCYARANLLQLSPFSNIASPDSVIGFSEQPNGRQINVQWQTALEGDNHFQIDHSTDSLTWTSVASVPGSDTTAKAYQAIINEPQNGQNYYRLELFDEDNKMTLSPVKSYYVNSNAAPITFTALPGSKVVNLAFSTLSEYFNDHFNIQSSTDSVNWTALTTVTGAGTAADTSTYQAVDSAPVSGFNYYRLQYYKGGTLTYYPIVQKVDTRPSVIIASGTALVQGSDISLQLTTSTEVNNPGFIAQKSSDGSSWQQLAANTLNSRTSFVNEYYSTLDDNPFMGMNYYRLQYYLHGSLIFSPAISVNFSTLSLNVYPNPSNSNVSFDLKGYSGKTFDIVVTSLFGNQVAKQTVLVSSSGHYVIPTTASSGIYILNISGDGLAKSIRVLVQ
jgi:hypothetical protein